MKNTLTDLNNHLYAQVERLSEEELVTDPLKLEAEIARGEAIIGVARMVVENASLVLKAHKLASDGEFSTLAGKKPQLLE